MTAAAHRQPRGQQQRAGVRQAAPCLGFTTAHVLASCHASVGGPHRPTCVQPAPGPAASAGRLPLSARFVPHPHTKRPPVLAVPCRHWRNTARRRPAPTRMPVEVAAWRCSQHPPPQAVSFKELDLTQRARNHPRYCSPKERQAKEHHDRKAPTACAGAMQAPAQAPMQFVLCLPPGAASQQLCPVPKQ